MTDLSERLSEWIPTVQGQYINVDWNPTNRGFGAQCWDLAAHWSLFLGLPVINTGGKGRWPGWAGNMVDAFPQTPAIAAAYQLVSPDQPGQAGDIAVWGDSYWYYPSTHVAPLIRDLGAQLLCMSQNSTPAQAGNPYPGDSTGPTTIQHLPRQGLIGFIRPRPDGIAAMGEPITPLEEDMGFVDGISDDAAEKIAGKVLAKQVKREGSDTATNTLGWSLGAEQGRTEGIIARTAAAAAAGVLFTKFKRQGPGQTGETDLASVISWFDHGVQHAGSRNGEAPSVGLDPAAFAAQIGDAIADSLQRGAEAIRAGEQEGGK